MLLLLLSSLFFLCSGVQMTFTPRMLTPSTLKPVITNNKIIGELINPVDNRKSKELVQKIDIAGERGEVGHLLSIGYPGYKNRAGYKCLDPSGCCDSRSALDSEKHAVQCCSDEALEGFKSKERCTVWAARDVWSEGCQILSWNDANKFCQSKNARLCTNDEVTNRCTWDIGCKYDLWLVWTSSEAVLESPTDITPCVLDTSSSSGWYEFQDSTYLYDFIPRSWEDAKAFCYSKGANLASITSEVENSFVTDITEEQTVWIGGNDPTNENDWKWSDGSCWGYENWAKATNEPNNWKGLPENCLELYGRAGVKWNEKGEWNDLSCNALHRVVCERSPTIIPCAADVIPCPIVTPDDDDDDDDDDLSPTPAPTTPAPTTQSPTLSPTTQSPTLSPTTQSPTLSPTTQSPTLSPTTQSPTTPSPTTPSPTTPSPTLPLEDHCVRERDIDYYGNDLDKKQHVSLGYCGVLCQRTDGCRYWTFGTVENDEDTCFMKTSNAGRRMHKGLFSGNRLCGD